MKGEKKRIWLKAVRCAALFMILFHFGKIDVSGQSEAKLKVDLEKARTMAETDRQRTDDFKQLIAKIAPNFKQVPTAEGSSTNRFFYVTLNQTGAGFDGIRFRVSPGQDRSFIWIFACTKKNPILRWTLTDANGQVAGFQGFKQSSGRSQDRYYFGHAYDVVVPWGRDANDHITIIHYAEGVLKAGQEYWIWIEFKDGTSTQLQGAITLPPAGTKLSSPQEQEYVLDLLKD